MDPHSEQRLAEVSPTLAANIRTAAAVLARKGIELRVVQGLRTAALQAALYAQGRTAPGKIVTNAATPALSSHGYGLAVDAVPGLIGVTPWTPNWDEADESPIDHEAYKEAVEAIKATGVKWGGDWVHMKGDYDHFYIGPDSPTAAMRADLAKGLPVVFAQCDAGVYSV